MDYFPLFPLFGLVLFGLFVGKNSDLSKIEKKLEIINYKPLTKIGKNCLNLYTAHFVFLMIIYNIKNKILVQ